MKIKKKFNHNKFIWWFEQLEENFYKPKLIPLTEEQMKIIKKGEENIEKRKSRKES